MFHKADAQQSRYAAFYGRAFSRDGPAVSWFAELEARLRFGKCLDSIESIDAERGDLFSEIAMANTG